MKYNMYMGDKVKVKGFDSKGLISYISRFENNEIEKINVIINGQSYWVVESDIVEVYSDNEIRGIWKEIESHQDQINKLLNKNMQQFEQIQRLLKERS